MSLCFFLTRIYVHKIPRNPAFTRPRGLCLHPASGIRRKGIDTKLKTLPFFALDIRTSFAGRQPRKGPAPSSYHHHPRHRRYPMAVAGVGHPHDAKRLTLTTSPMRRAAASPFFTLSSCTATQFPSVMPTLAMPPPVTWNRAAMLYAIWNRNSHPHLVLLRLREPAPQKHGCFQRP